jgi:hypothetical protein
MIRKSAIRRISPMSNCRSLFDSVIVFSLSRNSSV